MSLDPQQVLDNAARLLSEITDHDDRLVGLIQTYAELKGISVADACKAVFNRVYEMKK
jgi:hypothetical protein